MNHREIHRRKRVNQQVRGTLLSAALFCLLVTLGIQLILYYKLANRNTTRQLKPPEPISPRRQGSYDGISACLLLKNDNEKLAEWLAYHWLVLPLRHLIVAIDPTGTTTPEDILRLWNNTLIPSHDETHAERSRKLMDILIWGDADYDHFIDPRYQPLDRHRDRQVHFYRSCMRYHKKKGRTWVALIDSDEYITYNPFVMDEGEQEGDTETLPETPDMYKNDAYVQMMQHLRKQLPSFTVDKTMLKRRGAEHLIVPERRKAESLTVHPPPDVRWIKPTSVIDFLNDQPYSVEPCLLMPRLFFSAVELTQKDHDAIVSQWGGVHPFAGYESRYNISHFRTMRYVHHQRKTAWAHNLFGKVMIDVSRIEDSELNYESEDSNNMWLGYVGAHNPLGNNSSGFFPAVRPLRTSLLRVNHYLGSLEEYMARPDDRRSKRSYEQRARIDMGANYELLPWLQVFVDEVGDDTAQALLKPAGFLVSGHVRIIDSKDYVPVFPKVSRWWDSTLSRRVGNVSHSRKDLNTSCALLFFGVGRQFLDVAFPSIQKFILDVNPDCDIFVHSYNVTTIQSDSTSHPYDPNDIFIFSKHYSQRCRSIEFDTEDEFRAVHNMNYYRLLFPQPAFGWSFPTSMDNMIHQWHSIARVWASMSRYEARTSFSVQYHRVGLFRLDLKYAHPIPIDDGDAVIPSMMYIPHVWNGLNDRIFFGVRSYAEIWATKRFDAVDGYIKLQKTRQTKSSYGEVLSGLHSENFLAYLMTEKFQFPLIQRDMCFYRTRSDGTFRSSDCEWLLLTLSMKIPEFQVPGIIVLGMHRSGTSLLSGLLAQIFNLRIPGEQVRAENYPEQNAKGFFEPFDVVRQNDEWLQMMNMSWDNLGPLLMSSSTNVDSETIFSARYPGQLGWNGISAIQELNNIENAPWLIKDPRLCITLQKWLPHLDGSRPAIIFTYRNPIHVAKSLSMRKRNPVSLERGIELWIAYNREAIHNSNNLCRIVTSNARILANTTGELTRISKELYRCGLDIKALNLTAASDFVDGDMQQDNKKSEDTTETCAKMFHNSTFGEVKCRKAVKIFDDLTTGEAFKVGYDWTYPCESITVGDKNINDVKLYQKEKSSVSTQDGLAACLLLKNDNEKLAEWLAYHWLVLPLRHLIVAIDPTGTTTPEDILRLWNNTLIPSHDKTHARRKRKLMNILIWGDADYDHFIDPQDQPLDRHRDRQVHFYRSCMRYHKKKGRTWVALIDSDEYITYNPFVMDEGEMEGDTETLPETPDMYKNEAYVQMMQHLRKQLPSFTVDKTMHENRGAENLTVHPPPDVRWIKPTSVVDFLNDQPYSVEPCLLMPRLFFSAVELTQKDHDAIVSQWGGVHPFAGYESWYNISNFRTMRYVHHQRKTAWANNLFGKVMIDVSRIDNKEFIHDHDTSGLVKVHFLTPHRPLGWSRVKDGRQYLLCQNPRKPYRTSLLRVNHYLGSLEEYMARPDNRRSLELYKQRTRIDMGANYEILPWLQVFIDEVGNATAQELLKTAGSIEF